MAQRRISMHKIQDILRLSYEAQLSGRSIARSLSISRDAVSDTLTRAKLAGLTWPLPDGLDAFELETLLYPPSPGHKKGYPEPNWNNVFHELRRKGVTLLLLWVEYKTAHPDGCQYSQFCELYRRFEKTLQVSLRQSHKAGEKCFLDYAGPTIPFIDPETGEVCQAYLFVAVLGASNYTYVEAQRAQDLPSWIAAHGRMFTFFGGVPALLVPDNLKAGVTRAHRYEPIVNRTYWEMAAHYGTAVLPTRPRKPKDKSKVEAAVLLVERWILAVLRNHTFFGLAEVNEAVAKVLTILNEKPFQKIEGSRRSLYETLDRPALRPLPSAPYEWAVWHKAKVPPDYHIEVEKSFYSVPHSLVTQEVESRVTERIVEIFRKGRRVASHTRATQAGSVQTDPAHRPKAHQQHLDWTPDRLIEWGARIGGCTSALVEHMLHSRPHPEQGYRACLGLLSLEKQFSSARLEAAAGRALAIGACSYRSVKSILERGIDQLEIEPIPETNCPLHENVRGAAYYQPSASTGKRGLVH